MLYGIFEGMSELNAAVVYLLRVVRRYLKGRATASELRAAYRAAEAAQRSLKLSRE